MTKESTRVHVLARIGEPAAAVCVTTNMVRLKFSLRSLFALATAACLLCGVSVHIGLLPVATTLLCISGIVLWGYVYNQAPDATKYFSIWAMIGMVLFSILSMYLLRSRDATRRTNSSEILRRIDQQRMLENELNFSDSSDSPDDF